MRTSGPDPYRTLGLAPGATEEEVKRAYRALVKRHHPDGSQGSVDRFLEVQAAYEALVGDISSARSGAPRRGRQPAQPGRPGRSSPGSRGAGPGAGAEASRDTRAGPDAGPSAGPGGGRGAPAGSEWARRARPGGSRRPGAGAGREPGAGAEPSWGGTRTGDSARGGSEDDRGGPAGQRRATLGSTSYDEAEEVFEPDWEGASWYGPTSRTYWTINPKEYADPRKHGPEYQARGRRRAAAGSAGGEAAEGPGESEGTADGGEDATTARDGEAGSETASEADSSSRGGAPGRASPGRASSGRSSPSDLPPAWRARAWTAAGPAAGAPAAFEHQAPPGAGRETDDSRAAGSGPPRGGTSAGVAASTAAGPAVPAPGARSARPRLVVRLGLALLGWVVPGLAIAALAGIPGGLLPTLPLQVAGVAILAARPRIAWAAAGGGLALVFAAIPIVTFVSALGGPFVPAGPAPPAAAALALAAWLGGVALAAAGRVAPYPWGDAV